MRLTCGVLAVLSLVASAGCSSRAPTVAAAFPAAHVARPWVLDGAVWSGSFAEASESLADEAEAWRAFAPERVWLAVYHHDTAPARRLHVRVFAVPAPDVARQALQRFKPAKAEPFVAGDEGYWTEIGVMFAWGRLVVDVFGDEPTWRNEIHAATLAGYLQTHMPPGLPDDPR